MKNDCSSFSVAYSVECCAQQKRASGGPHWGTGLSFGSTQATASHVLRTELHPTTRQPLSRTAKASLLRKPVLYIPSWHAGPLYPPATSTPSTSVSFRNVSSAEIQSMLVQVCEA